MYTRNFSNLFDLHDGLTQRVALATDDKLDYVNSQDCQLHDVVVTADSCEMGFDLKDYWLTKSRWTTLIRQYIDPVALNDWLDLIEAKMKGGKRGQAFMRTKTVESRGTKKVSRQWGSCIIGFGFRAAPKPKLTMHSRTSFLGYIALLDLNVASVLAKLIAERLDIEPSEISFIWHLDNAQFHYNRSMGWWYGSGRGPYIERARKGTKERPGLRGSFRFLEQHKAKDARGELYGESKFAAALRPRKRWHTEELGLEYARQFEGGPYLGESARKAYKPLPSVMSDTLNFDSLREEGDLNNADYMDECCCSE